MHILLVNDDGIQAKGIQALVKAAVKRGHELSVCAPSVQQSAASHRITIHEPIFITEYPFEDKNVTGYAIAGTPADCTRLAIFNLIEKPIDIVVSGINIGYNAGADVQYSGTVGAAMEAVMLGYRAIACSMHINGSDKLLEGFAEYVIAVAEKYQKTPMQENVLNINAPLDEECLKREKIYAPLNEIIYSDQYEYRVSPRKDRYFWLKCGTANSKASEKSDAYYLKQGHITHTLVGYPTVFEEKALNGLDINLL